MMDLSMVRLRDVMAGAITEYSKKGRSRSSPLLSIYLRYPRELAVEQPATVWALDVNFLTSVMIFLLETVNS
jgi:hypothetical protein